MIRSLLAVIFATLAGLALARFIESAALSVFGAESSGYTAGLAFAWFAGALAAALAAMVIGQRWAPLGGLGAATITLSAIIGLSGGGLALILWPVAFISTAIGGYLAIRLLKAPMAYPVRAGEKELFND